MKGCLVKEFSVNRLFVKGSFEGVPSLKTAKTVVTVHNLTCFFTKVSCNNLSDRFSSLEKVFSSELKIPSKYSQRKSCSN